jgi:mannosyltransferase OCH1-like enzyme
MQACRSFEPIHSRLEFYAGYCYGNLVACGIFASKPDSPILNSMIENLRKSIDRYNFDVFDPDVIMDATGPQFFTKIIEEILPSTDNRFNIILPHQYFQPVECQNRGVPKTKIEFYNIEKMCFAIDHNGSSWVP